MSLSVTDVKEQVQKLWNTCFCIFFIFKFKIISTDTFKNPKKDVFVKLGYSEKATEFEKIFHLKFDATQ